MDNQETKKSSKSGIVTAVFFVFSLVVVAVIAINEFTGDHDRNLENVDFNVLFLFGAIGCFLVALLCETIKYSFLLKGRGINKRWKLGFTTAVIGKYYDNLTPAGAGGQGFQMYHLKKNGCDYGTAGGLPIIGFLGLQFAFVILGILTMVLGRAHISDDLMVIKVTAIIGLVFYAFVPVCILFFIVAPKPLEAIVKGGTFLLAKIRIIKNPENTVEKAIGSLQDYTTALRNFGKQGTQIVMVMVTSLIYQAAFMSMPYFVLHFFGASIGFVDCFCRVVYIYSAITLVFTPGNSGAAEASFYMVFTSLSGGAIFWGMLVWRGLCYYSWIIFGAVIQLWDRLADRKKGSGDKAK